VSDGGGRFDFGFGFFCFFVFFIIFIEIGICNLVKDRMKVLLAYYYQSGLTLT